MDNWPADLRSKLPKHHTAKGRRKKKQTEWEESDIPANFPLVHPGTLGGATLRVREPDDECSRREALDWTTLVQERRGACCTAGLTSLTSQDDGLRPSAPPLQIFPVTRTPNPTIGKFTMSDRVKHGVRSFLLQCIL